MSKSIRGQRSHDHEQIINDSNHRASRRKPIIKQKLYPGASDLIKYSLMLRC